MQPLYIWHQTAQQQPPGRCDNQPLLWIEGLRAEPNLAKLRVLNDGAVAAEILLEGFQHLLVVDGGVDALRFEPGVLVWSPLGVDARGAGGLPCRQIARALAQPSFWRKGWGLDLGPKTSRLSDYYDTDKISTKNSYPQI